jgi:hypothetical protein
VVAALEQVDTQRGVPFRGESLADAPDVVVKPVGLMGDNDIWMGSGAFREDQLRNRRGTRFSLLLAQGMQTYASFPT